jgi:hypothetical protein
MMKMAGVDTELLTYSYEPYDDVVDYELARIMNRASVSHCSLQLSPPSMPPQHLYQQPHYFQVHPLLRLETYGPPAFDPLQHGQTQALPANPMPQQAEYGLEQRWAPPTSHVYPQMMHGVHRCPPDGVGSAQLQYPHEISTMHQTSRQCYDEADHRSPWSSSPEHAHTRPLEILDDEDNTTDEKPYARLIYDALMAAPGHKMMLKEIYEWFRRNTNKPIESGSNGWQNSIRHNLSMNKVSTLCVPNFPTSANIDFLCRHSKTTEKVAREARGKPQACGC